jgi:hypothetical protein
MSVVIDGTTGITTPAFTIDALTTTGNSVLGDSTTDTLNVGNGGLVKDASGNVGIGTATPGYRLDVQESGGVYNIARFGYTTSYSTYIYRDSAYWGFFDAPSFGGNGFTGHATNNYLTLQTAGTERMRIDSSGNVGIGTASPAYKLDVSRGASDGFTARIGRATGTAFYMYSDTTNSYLSTDTSLNNSISLNPSGNYISFTTTNGTERMRIDSSGMVLPGANATYDLGSSSLRWRNVYTSDLHLNNGIGNYTIVEGEEDLFLYNNKNGKTYKFALVEVDKSEAPPKMKEA